MKKVIIIILFILLVVLIIFSSLISIDNIICDYPDEEYRVSANNIKKKVTVQVTDKTDKEVLSIEKFYIDMNSKEYNDFIKELKNNDDHEKKCKIIIDRIKK